MPVAAPRTTFVRDKKAAQTVTPLAAVVAGSTTRGSFAAGLPLFLQPKLAISQPNDPAEVEADRVAEQVMRMPDPAVQRQCTACSDGGSPCSACEDERLRVSRKAHGDVGGEVPASVHSVLSSPGQPLALSTRAFFEPRFGQDLSHVRVHTDGNAQQSARDVSALAYAVGSHVVFDTGRYAPHSTEGQRLMAHELTHVVQQGRENQTERIHRKERYCPNGEVDDDVVQGHIDRALSFARTRGGGVSLKVAFARLRTLRENNCCDLNLAAAEHYMWARLQVAEGDWSFAMIMLIILYDLAKFIHLVPKTGDCPITRASTDQIRWASQGAVDGDMDYYSTPP